MWVIVKTFRIFVVRHGETDFSRERRFAGARDIGLTEHGRRQCVAVAAALGGEPVAAVYSSPLERARATAEVVAKPHRLAVREIPAFREMAFGSWEGLTREELTAGFPEASEAWARTPHLVTPPGGESLAAVGARVAEGLGDLRARHAGETVVLVTHAIVTRLLVLDALGLGPERLWTVDASPAGLTEIEYQPAWTVIHRMNTLSHLEAAAPGGVGP